MFNNDTFPDLIRKVSLLVFVISLVMLKGGAAFFKSRRFDRLSSSLFALNTFTLLALPLTAKSSTISGRNLE